MEKLARAGGLRVLLRSQMVSMQPNVSRIGPMGGDRVRILQLFIRPGHRLFPTVFLCVAVSKGNHRAVAAVQRPGRGEPILLIIERNFKRRKADAHWLRIDEHKRIRRVSKFRTASIKVKRWKRSILRRPKLEASIEIIVHRVTSTFLHLRLVVGLERGFFARANIHRWSLQIRCERGPSGIRQRPGIHKSSGGPMNRAFDPI